MTTKMLSRWPDHIVPSNYSTLEAIKNSNRSLGEGITPFKWGN